MLLWFGILNTWAPDKIKQSSAYIAITLLMKKQKQNMRLEMTYKLCFGQKMLHSPPHGIIQVDCFLYDQFHKFISTCVNLTK